MNLDEWVSAPAVRTHHRRRCECPPDVLWRAAGTVRLRDCRLLGRLVQARIPGLRSGSTFRAVFSAYPFRPLEEGERYQLTGLCGRIWTVRRDFGELRSPEDFRAWSKAGTVRVLFANWAEPTARGSALVSEVRVGPVDRRARLNLRTIGPFIAAFQGLVGTEALNAAVSRAASDGRG